MTWPTAGPDPSWSDVWAVLGAVVRDRLRRLRKRGEVMGGDGSNGG